MAGELPPFLVDLAIILAVAAASTILFHRLRQPVVLGYLLAGMIVGPFTPPFALVGDVETIRVLGEVGVVFLLFALGLEFNLRKLRRVGATALVSGTLQVALMMWLGYLVGRAFGFEPIEAVFLGAIVSISSTVIIVKVVAEMGQQEAQWAQVIFGILIVEDVLAVLMLTVLGAVGDGAGGVGGEIVPVLGMFALFLVLALLLGMLLVPRLVAFVGRLGVDEVLLVTALALGVGLAVMGGVLGFSPALGAFLMGALIGETALHRIIEERVAPVRDLFSAIFFVTVGMLVDPRALVEHWPLILAVTACVIGGKILAGSFATFVAGRDVTTSLRVGFGLAQVGEFSFILAALAGSLGVADAPLYVVAVSAAAITAFTTPLLMRRAPQVASAFERIAPGPVLTYTSMYGAWTRRLRELRVGDPERGRVRRDAWFAALYAAATLAALVLGGAAVQRAGAALTGWAVVAAIAILFALLYVRAQHRLAASLSDAALPHEQPSSPKRVLLARTFLLGGLLVVGTAVLAVASLTVPLGVVLAVMGGGALLAGLLMYRALARVQEDLESALHGLLGDAPEQGRRDLLEIVREKYPWAASVRDVTMPASDARAPLTLRRLHLRGRTGASVVAIQRAGKLLLNPAPDTPLVAADRVVLMGSQEQVDAAEALLAGSVPLPETEEEPEPASGQVRVVEGAPLAGRTLGEVHLMDRTGVSVLAIERAGERLPHPGSQTRMQAGDVLVVLGTPSQIDRVRALAGGAG